MIVFEKITARNFISVGNVPISLNLNAHQLTLVEGKNGSGKSQFLDAICFALYGKAYRNITKPLLVNSINQKQCEVSIEFSIGKKKYKIVRGIKPSKFEIYENDKLVNQDPNVKDYQKVLEQQILRMNYRAFTQVVVIGSAGYVPFMKLSTQHRREFIEDLLDIRVFSIMNSLVKEQIKSTKEQLKDIDADIRLVKEKITLQESFIKKQEKEKHDSTHLLLSDVTALESENDNHQTKVNEYIEQLNVLTIDSSKYENLNELLSSKKHHLKSLKSTINTMQEECEWYLDIEECPQCKQGIEHSHKTTIIDDTKLKIAEMQIEVEMEEDGINDLNDEYALWQEIIEKESVINLELTKLNKLILVNNAMIRSKNEHIESATSDTSSIDDEKRKLKDYAKEILAMDKDRKTITEIQHYQNASSMLLQDTGIKAKIINQYVPVINKLVNKYLDSLDFFCQFCIDSNFNEVVKSRYRDDFVYDSFSEGQKFRIDSALLFTWMHIAESKNSASCNLLFADEIMDGSVDQAGIDLLLNLMRQQKKKNIFIVSHREGLVDKFDHTISVSTQNNFTMIN